MSWNPCAALLCTLLGLGPASNWVDATTAANKAELESFYIVAEFFSDASPFWFHYILEAKLDQNDTVVRFVRIAPLDQVCSNVTVKAMQTRMKDTTPAKLLGAYDLCGLSEGQFGRALEKARSKRVSSIDDTSRYGVVARCGKTEKVFHLPYPEKLDFERLKKQDPQVGALWDAFDRVAKTAFGDAADSLSEGTNLSLFNFGASMVPDLRSGKFDAGFWCSCTNRERSRYLGPKQEPSCDPHPAESDLDGYRGPIQSIPVQKGRLLGGQSLHFVKYVDPEYPVLAKMARIQGRVGLELVVNQSGGVERAGVLFGHDLLARSALEAAQRWRFESGFGKQPEVVVVVDYSFQCP